VPTNKKATKVKKAAKAKMPVASPVSEPIAAPATNYTPAQNTTPAVREEREEVRTTVNENREYKKYNNNDNEESMDAYQKAAPYYKHWRYKTRRYFKFKHMQEHCSSPMEN
jgi:ssDNA-binding replication factor A large subunit